MRQQRRRDDADYCKDSDIGLCPLFLISQPTNALFLPPVFGYPSLRQSLSTAGVLMDFEKFGKLIDQWKGLLTGIGLLLAAIVGVHKALTDLDFRTWSWPEIAVATAAIVLLAIVTVRSRKAHLSRLIDPDALKLDPQSPEQLVGRREDLDKLLKALANPLVFLVSESGCGKSALLRAGIAQGPAFTQRFLPVYIDMSVLDWEDGPLRAVREGFAQALPNDDPARSKLNARSTPRQYAEAFGDYYRRTQRRPLLLLDQFDDYQADSRHRERFLPPETRVWRNADATPAKTRSGACSANACKTTASASSSRVGRMPRRGLRACAFNQTSHNSTCPGLSRGWCG